MTRIITPVLLRKSAVWSITACVISMTGLCHCAYGDTFKGTRADKGDIRANYDSSVASYAAIDYTPFFDNARTVWSTVSSKVNILKVTTTTNSPDKYYVGDDDLGNGTTGITRYYYKSSTGVVQEVSSTPDHDITFATVALYDDSMNNFGYSDTNRKATAAHELGHSLKLAHPGSGTDRKVPIPAGQKSIMTQGQKDYGVQQYDKNDIIAKWGR